MEERRSSKAGPILFGAVSIAIIVFFYWFLGHE
jgi:hypothetical protein